MQSLQTFPRTKPMNSFLFSTILSNTSKSSTAKTSSFWTFTRTTRRRWCCTCCSQSCQCHIRYWSWRQYRGKKSRKGLTAHHPRRCSTMAKNSGSTHHAQPQSGKTSSLKMLLQVQGGWLERVPWVIVTRRILGSYACQCFVVPLNIWGILSAWRP